MILYKMPEIVEIAIFVNKLLIPTLRNRLLLNIEFTDYSKYFNVLNNSELIKLLSSELCGIDYIGYKGKLIYFILSNGYYIVQSFGLYGGWYINYSKKASIILEYRDDENSIDIKKLYYCDKSKMGNIIITNDKNILINKLKLLGPDVSEDLIKREYNEIIDDISIYPKFTYEIFKSRICDKKNLNKNICKILLDQSIISGIGNYLKCEILYDAKINPFLKVCDLNENDLLNIYSSIRIKIMLFYNCSGNIAKYTDFITDKKLSIFNVYEKKLDCYLNEIIKVKTPDNRYTYYVQF